MKNKQHTKKMQEDVVEDDDNLETIDISSRLQKLTIVSKLIDEPSELGKQNDWNRMFILPIEIHTPLVPDAGTARTPSPFRNSLQNEVSTPCTRRRLVCHKIISVRTYRSVMCIDHIIYFSLFDLFQGPRRNRGSAYEEITFSTA